MKISVEDYHIRSGFQKSGCNCPVALAITPRLKAGWVASINGNEADGYEGSVFGDGKNFKTRFTLPPDVQDRIKRFDTSGKMEPFEFEITVS